MKVIYWRILIIDLIKFYENLKVRKVPKKMYMSIWRNKQITSHAGTIDDFINTFEAQAKQFRQWKEWGFKLHDDGIGDDYATFITDDMDVAIKAGFTVYIGGDHETKYLIKLSGSHYQKLLIFFRIKA